MANKKSGPELDQSNIQDASTAEILSFAKGVAGLTFTEGTNRDYMLEKVFEALAWIPKAVDETATHVMLKIAASPSEQGGMNDVRLGHNGRMMTLKRNIETEVPIEFYNVLQDINNLGFDVPELKKGKLENETPLERIVDTVLYPVQIIRFINKGNTE